MFYKDDAGEIFHTYSTYGRGVEVMMGTYSMLDLTPKGRDERDVEYKMEWVRHHDRYEPAPVAKAPPATGSVEGLFDALKNEWLPLTLCRRRNDMSEAYLSGCAGGAIRSESGHATALRAADWLRLAAAPTFAIMALLTAVLGGGQPDILCSTVEHSRR